MSRIKVPRDKDNDYSADIAATRRQFVADQAGAELQHMGAFSFDSAQVSGNIENFTGVAQIPVGIAGPVLINGEHARGEFYVPLATQREGLEILGCYGRDKAGKFAEIVAATVLAGDISLASSVMAGDFVAAHDKYGRNRP